jgi:hypothetical protein
MAGLDSFGGNMKKFKSRVLFHGGSIPIPSYYQKGKIKIIQDEFEFKASGKKSKHDIYVRVPLSRVSGARTEEKKYYSSTAYMLIVDYLDTDGKAETLELEIRSFGRRGRAQAISRLWAETLRKQGKSFDAS